VRRPVLSLALLSFLTFFLALGRQAITDSDEAFYAEASREMVESGDWLTPHFNDEQRWQKPILYYWLTAGLYLAAGPTEWAARFWSALSGLGLALLTWVAARTLSADDTRGGSSGAASAWLAGAIVATCFGYVVMARAALPDLPLAFCITLAIWSALQRKWILAAVAAALGFLLKGPVALAIPVVVLIPIWWRGRHVTPVPMRDLAVAAVVFAAIVLPWYAVMTLEHGSAYLESFFLGDNLARFATDRFNEPRPVWFYVPIVIGGMLPWSMYLLVLPWPSIKAVVRRQQRLSGDEWRLLLWALVPLVFFTISIGKQPRYILPVLPPLAILLAGAIARRTSGATGTPERGLVAATWLTAALYLALAVLLYRARPLFIAAFPWLTSAGTAALAACGGLMAWAASARRWRELPAVAAACAVVMALTVQFGALAGIRPEPVEQMAALVRAERRADEPVGEYQAFVRNLVFYLRLKQVDLFDEARALDFLRSPERVLLVVRASDLPRLESISSVPTRRLGQIRYLNTASLRLRTLLSPIPQQDLETVLLVTNK
jgi:4-amino-4-deoxy-L-arabinose transferase-like glycosyltransferase